MCDHPNCEGVDGTHSKLAIFIAEGKKDSLIPQSSYFTHEKSWSHSLWPFFRYKESTGMINGD